MFNVRNIYREMTSSFNGWQSVGDFGYFENYTRRVDVLPMTSISEGISNPKNAGGVENKEGIESNAGPIWKPSADGSKIVLFSEPKPIPIELEYEGSEGKGSGKDAEEDPWFRVYLPLT
ncbi:hypothetical protein PVK06_019641 [Gossypium arboreum]|uniref:Uncharacterized protein n=1 Tax=Gossypium arboreum TaxID=29729 RepID=A0ABR0PKN0_GOSAR|nr:hypothetical protein PVK06_019641 [Gossypium arboreum]